MHRVFRSQAAQNWERTVQAAAKLFRECGAVLVWYQVTRLRENHLSGLAQRRSRVRGKKYGRSGVLRGVRSRRRLEAMNDPIGAASHLRGISSCAWKLDWGLGALQQPAWCCRQQVKLWKRRGSGHHAEVPRLLEQ